MTGLEIVGTTVAVLALLAASAHLPAALAVIGEVRSVDGLVLPAPADSLWKKGSPDDRSRHGNDAPALCYEAGPVRVQRRALGWYLEVEKRPIKGRRAARYCHAVFRAQGQRLINEAAIADADRLIEDGRVQ